MNQARTEHNALDAIDQDAAMAMVDAARSSLLNEIQRGRSVEEATAKVREREAAQFAPLGTAGEAVLALKLEALVRAHQDVVDDIARVSYMQQSSLRSGREAWYAGPAEDAANWQGLRKRLVDQGRGAEEIALVDEESTTILSLIDNPGKESFSTRGLVIGHVQSGKTGNMAALIAKAADTPFKFVVVLSGLTDSLRNQTQGRLDSDVIGTAPAGQWYRWTTVNTRVNDVLVNGDFTSPAGGTFQLQGHGNHLAVIKKNAGVLRRFLRTLQQTPMRDLEATPFLIIDDECDQASVNSAPLQRAITRINDLIRQIIAHLPRVAYVGYTATPFANVLIDPRVPGDLYPRHFIHPLRRPDAYFGAQELFGRRALDGEAEDVDSGFDMIRVVPSKQVPSLRPTGGKGFSFEVTESLDRAIRYFVMVNAAREMRGQGHKHMSMLVHTSMLNSVHRLSQDAISRHLENLVARLQQGDVVLLEELRTQWQEELASVPASDFGREATEFATISPVLHAAANAVEIKVENWRSNDRIDYSDSEPPRRYLVIGGNVLARGLTLDGLAVSFFMRTSSQYDTLMQMGRWFGYRPGFEDLPRVWMEEGVRNDFFDLATVEEEIRREASHYARAQVTPEDFAIRIRKIPGMMITARNKMQAHVLAQVGYAGKHLQTIRFRRHAKPWLLENWTAASALVDGSPEATMIRGNWVIKGVEVDLVRTFLARYQVHDTNTSMRSGDMLKYIARSLEHDSSLARWNIVVMGSASGNGSEQPLGRLGAVKCVNRAPMKGSGDDASIKALMSKDDLLGDLDSLPDEDDRTDWNAIKDVREGRRLPPLLVLYPIDRNSKPMFRSAAATSSSREDMRAAMDLLGVGIYFPGRPETSQSYVSANLQPVEPEEEFEEEDAIPAEVVDDAR